MRARVERTVSRGMPKSRGGRRAHRSRTRNQYAQESTDLGEGYRAHGNVGRSAVSSLRFRAKYSGKKARANCAREQHRMVEALDDHGEYACLALGSGAKLVRIREFRKPPDSPSQRFSGYA